MRKITLIFFALFLICFFGDPVLGVEPVTGIKANGLDGSITITGDKSLSITVELDPGDFENMVADWWIAAYTLWGEWVYCVYPGHWEIAGSGLTGISPVYQGPLFNFPPFAVLDISGLPSGVYPFYFAIDTSMNGALESPIYYDSVTVNVKNAATYSIHGLNFSPYIDANEDPDEGGSQITDGELKQRLGTVVGYTKWVRTFGCNDDLKDVGLLAHAMGMKTAMAAWLGSNPTDNERQMACLIDQAKKGYADLAIIGSEVLLRGDLTVNELIEHIDRFKREVPEVPVSYVDVYGIVLSHPDIINAIDVVMVNYYPYWEGIGLDHAVVAIHAWHQQILSAAKGKPVMVSETGWPSCGERIGDAVPSEENAAFYFLNFVSWARAAQVGYFYFETFDEAWKTRNEGPQGACWGIWDGFGNLKSGMETVFDGETMEDNWTEGSIPGGPGDPAIEFTYVPPYGDKSHNLEGQVWHVHPVDYKVAVYICVSGQWWNKPTFAEPLTTIKIDGSWVCDITTGGIDETATKIAAFLLPNGYDPPLISGEASLPVELNQKSVAKTETARTP